MRRLAVVCIVFFVMQNLFSQETPFPVLTGEYLGQEPPGLTPAIFAPGIISTDLSEGCSGWGNNMEFFVFQRWINHQPYLFITNQVEGIWTKPEPLPGIEQFQIGDFTLAPDGTTIAFASNIPITGIASEGEDGNIWLMEKTDTGWGEPEPVASEVNTKYHDSYPSLATNKNLYYFSRKPGGYGQSDLYLSRFVSGKYEEPLSLGGNLNTEHHEWDPFIAPDESYMVYCSMIPGGLGEDDLYITWRQEDGTWGKPIHLGNRVNSWRSENRPYVSPNGKYLFFTSDRRGNRDIYWVDTAIFDELRR